ncbi:hypothetical protein FFLO_05491 [Filobasidium floriforme]|uniref:PCI domain-containing protein n=1 Tax=Filobasidium floriforme TaxID=5210 RepID=A0A8K0JMA7_9TREE|nr:hypothetical protein FFLO_05491 [Filobasidium floriforme]
MAEKAARKQEKDYTAEVDTLIPELEGLVKQDGKVQDALDKLAAMEKQTRNAADLSSTSRLLAHLPKLLYNLPPATSLPQHFPTLISSLTTYSRKHGQLKEAVVRMVDSAMSILEEIQGGKGRIERKYVDADSEGDRWLDLVDCLRDITEGKIYLELQRARLTKMLASWYEELAASAPETNNQPTKPTAIPSLRPSDDEESKAGSTESSKEKGKRKNAVTKRDYLETAADLMTDVQVETYSSMDKREKTEFILDQMRLESTRDQWPRVRVGGRKIHRGFLKEKENADLKLRYYDLIIQLALHEDKYLDACKAYQEVWDTEEVKADPEKEKEAIENIIVFIVLAPYDNEQHDMLNKLYANTKLQKCVLHYELLKCFITKELMRWPGIEAIYGPTLRESSVFSQSIAEGEADDGTKRWNALHQRVIEHNIRVVASYYTQITLPRLTELLDLSAAEAERTLCRLVTDKVVRAKIDRPAGIVDFSPRSNPDEILNAWSGDLGKMLGLIEKTSHLINKEYAIHAARAAMANR